MIEAILAWKSAIIAGWFALLFAAERWAPAARAPKRDRLARNFGLWLAFLATSPAIAFPLTALASQHAFWGREAAHWPLLADFLILDLWTYWMHRAYHQNRWLWRLHAPHHLDEHLDTTSAGRFHFGEIIVSAAARAPLIMLLAIPIEHLALYDAALVLAALFHHSNLRLPSGLEKRLSLLIVTPSLHWVHHHAVRRDTNSNYSGVLSMWDRLFLSKSPTERRPDMPIGVEGMRDRPLLKLFAYPFSPESGTR